MAFCGSLCGAGQILERDLVDDDCALEPAHFGSSALERLPRAARGRMVTTGSENGAI
jgi:hypothetical protein